MRVSDSQRFNVALKQLTTHQARLIRATEQVSSGQRWSRISEDPVAGRNVMEIDSTLRGMTQTRRAIERARDRLASEENTLNQITDILARVRELATAQSGANANASTRAAAAVEVHQLRGQLISLGNQQVAGEFLYGGLETASAPFATDGSYNGTAQSRESQFGASGSMRVIHSGQEILVDSGALQALAELETALLANAPTDVQHSLTAITGAFDTTQSILAETGSRDRTLEYMSTTLDSREDSLTTQRAALAEIPLEEAMLKLATIQTALQAAYLATSRIQSLTLSEYLR